MLYLPSDLFSFLISFLSIPEDFENDNTETLSTMLQLAYTLAAAVVLVFGKWNTFSNLTQYEQNQTSPHNMTTEVKQVPSNYKETFLIYNIFSQYLLESSWIKVLSVW